uniref:Uncharacterized protein n=1 Tax=Rhizophora mucronata TaxID=61149 RepID=A0A2P2PHN9_RHIMU
MHSFHFVPSFSLPLLSKLTMPTKFRVLNNLKLEPDIDLGIVGRNWKLLMH